MHGRWRAGPNSHEFPPEDIRDAVERRGLLSMEIEFSRTCNFRCIYCYVEGAATANELTRDEACDVILQAKALGARRIIVLGGEPMLYPHISEMITFMREQQLDVDLFTNGTGMTRDASRFMYARGVKVIVKLNSLNPEVQDRLAGKKGAHDIIMAAFDNLTGAGYPSRGHILAASTVICRLNEGELATIWRWLRDRGIEPYFETLTPQGHAAEHAWLNIDGESLHRIFECLRDVDRTQYGLAWEPQPPLVGGRCLRHQFSCVVNAYGDVLPCVGVTLPVGNIRRDRLSDILKDSEVIQDLRNYRRRIKGPCRSCERSDECYGCRGAAYQLTGDYLASDPMCWRNLERRAEIPCLPAPVDGLIPHGQPMRIVDRLVRIGERSGMVESVIREDSPFILNDKTLDPAAYIEIIAQSIAAVNGFREGVSGGNGRRVGFLLGAKHLEVLHPARVGDCLRTEVFKDAQISNFGTVKGTVFRDGEVLARGEISVWHAAGGEEEG